MTNRTEQRIALWRAATPEEREEAKRRAGALQITPDQFRSACMIELEEMRYKQFHGAGVPATASQVDRQMLAAGEKA
jgi:hypothetical protein